MDHLAVNNFLLRSGLIKKSDDFKIISLHNTNPFKANITAIKLINGRKYVIKECKKGEVSNIYKAATLISQSRLKHRFEVSKPIEKWNRLILLDHLGPPLNVCNCKKNFKFDDIKLINNFFLKSGYIWGGVSLRNMFFVKSKYVLIDFEDFHKIKKENNNKRFIFFMRLNLLQSFNNDIVSNYILHIERKFNFTNRNRIMDPVEASGRVLFIDLFSKKRSIFFDHLDEITLAAEAPLNGNTLPFRISHTIDEVVMGKISLLWTLLMSKMRHDNIKTFKSILHVTRNVMKKNNINDLRFFLACLIIKKGLISEISYLKNIILAAKKCNDCLLYDKVILSAVKTVCSFLMIDFEKLHIVARGSYGECIMTTESDLDFEIIQIKNNRAVPLIELEGVIVDILKYIGIKADGSKKRPKEKDLKIGNESREFFELFGLRLISGNSKEFNKYIDSFYNLFRLNNYWRTTQTLYEKRKKSINNKSPFEEIRFVITRLFLLQNKNNRSVVLIDKLKMCPIEIRPVLEKLLWRAHKLRSDKKQDLQKIIELLGAMSKVRQQYNFLKNNYSQK